MFKARRLVIADELPYENVQILTHDEAKKQNIPHYFEDEEVVFKCKDGIFSTTIYQLVSIDLRKAIRIPAECDFAAAISMQHTITYENCYIIPNNLYKKYNIPDLFGDFQFTFIPDKEKDVLITNDLCINLIQWR